VIRYLVEQGGDIDRWFGSGGSPANSANWQADAERLKALLEAGADPHRGSPRSESPAYGRWDHGGKREAEVVEMIDMLVHAGVDPNVAAAGGTTPLHIAATCNTEAVIRALLDVGADPAAINDEGATALAIARGHERGSEIESLLRSMA